MSKCIICGSCEDMFSDSLCFECAENLDEYNVGISLCNCVVHAGSCTIE